MTSKNIMDYAASFSNPPKGYGLEIGLQAGKYRGEVISEVMKEGKTFEEAAIIAERKVIEKFGQPK